MLRTFAWVTLLLAAVVAACADDTPTGSGVLPGDQGALEDETPETPDARVDAGTDADAADAPTDAGDAADG